MVERFSEQKIKVFKEAFSLFDKNGDGLITASEIGTVMRSLDIPLTEEQLDNIVKGVDKDGNSMIDFPEFISMMAEMAPEDDAATNEDQALVDAFKVFDRDGNGYISVQELHQVMCALGEPLSLEEAEEMVREADSEGIGMINYHDFVTKLCNTPGPSYTKPASSTKQPAQDSHKT